MTTDPNIWHTSGPSVWPNPPSWMSYSTLINLEMCPMRWALKTADYPDVWNKHGYPHALQLAAVEGTVIHIALETIAKAMSESNCPSISDGSAVIVLKELGGFTAVLQHSVESALRPYYKNPRATSVIEKTRQLLTARVPELRTRVQSLLSRVSLEPRSVTKSRITDRSENQERTALPRGSHAEVELKVTELGWRGFADLITLSKSSCEIKDFKTGKRKDEHEFQLQTYALLWRRDRDLNPFKRIADKLVISYDDGDKEISPPTENELCYIEEEITRRTMAAIASAKRHPPEAKPSIENCNFCSVRHLCDEYWHAQLNRMSVAESPAEAKFGDLQVSLTARHGPTSWDGVVEVCSVMEVGQPILLRAANIKLDFDPGDRIRLLNVHLSVSTHDPSDDEITPAVATVGASSEAFFVPA